MYASYVDNQQFFRVPRSPHRNFDCVNETIHFSAFTVFVIKLLMSNVIDHLETVYVLLQLVILSDSLIMNIRVSADLN